MLFWCNLCCFDALYAVLLQYVLLYSNSCSFCLPFYCNLRCFVATTWLLQNTRFPRHFRGGSQALSTFIDVCPYLPILPLYSGDHLILQTIRSLVLYSFTTYLLLLFSGSGSTVATLLLSFIPPFEQGAPGSFVTNLTQNLSPNLVMNLVNHHVWW